MGRTGASVAARARLMAQLVGSRDAQRAAFVVANALWGAEVIGGALESLVPSRSQVSQ